MPPSLTVCNTDSLAEQIQRRFPDAKVVKAFNTVGNTVMTNPGAIPDSDIFLCGNDAQAKAKVVEIMKSFGWKRPVDVGDILGARGMEMLLPMWVRVFMASQNPNFNWKIAR